MCSPFRAHFLSQLHFRLLSLTAQNYTEWITTDRNSDTRSAWGVMRGCKGSAIPQALNHCGCWRGMTATAPKRPNNVRDTFFNRIHLLPEGFISNTGAPTCFLPRVPFNLVTPLVWLHTRGKQAKHSYFYNLECRIYCNINFNWSYLIASRSMGVGRTFSRGWPVGDFPKIFAGGIKSGEICFFPSKLKKQPFLLIISKSREGRGLGTPLPPLPTPMSRSRP